MRKGWQRFWSFALTICIVMSLFPVSASASDIDASASTGSAVTTTEPAAVLPEEPSGNGLDKLSPDDATAISYVTTRLSDGLIPSLYATGPQAEFNSRQGTFEEMWNAAIEAKSGTVKLLDDVLAVDASFGAGDGFSSNGGLIVGVDSTICLDLNSFVLNRGCSSSDRAPDALLTVNGKFTLDDTASVSDVDRGSIRGATGKSAISVTSTGTLTINNGSISDNGTIDTSIYAGVGVNIDNGSVIMNGGDISRNAGGTPGVGVHIAGGSFIMNDGSIINNTSNASGHNGSGIYCSSGTIVINGGTISGNSSAYYNGTVAGIYSSNVIVIKQTASDVPVVINGNTNVNRAADNITGPVVLGASLPEGSRIGLTAYAGTIAVGAQGAYTITQSDANKFHSDKHNTYLYLDTAANAIKTAQGTAPDMTQVITFDANADGAVVSPSSVNTDTMGILTEDNVPTPVYEGYSFKGWYTASVGGQKITFPYTFDAPMTLYAHWEAANAMYTPSSGDSEYGMFADCWNKAALSGGTVKLLDNIDAVSGAGGVMTFGTGAGFGSGGSSGTGGLYVPATSSITLDLNGYTLNRGIQMESPDGHVIYNEGQLIVTDTSGSNEGTITGGMSSDTAGGIHSAGASLTVSNVKILSNTSSIAGGGIYMDSGALNLNANTEISSNVAYSMGGGVFLNDGVTAKLQGPLTMTGNMALEYGGAIYVSSGTVQVRGNLQISDNMMDDIYLKDGAYLQSMASLAGSKFGITTENDPLTDGPITVGKVWTISTLTTPEKIASAITTTWEGGGFQYNSSAKTLELSGITECTVTFDANGGMLSGPSSAKTQSDGTLGANFPVDPTWAGHAFQGWFTQPSGGERVTSSHKFSSSTATIYAQWIETGYTITYNLGGGTAFGNPTSYTATTPQFTLVNPTRPGYTFVGWSGSNLYGSNNMTVTVNPATMGSSLGNLTYTANWQVMTNIQYRVEYYKEAVTGGYYEIVSGDTVTKNDGQTDQMISISSGHHLCKEYEGFVLNPLAPGSVTSGTVAADGSLVLKLYYDRNCYTIDVRPNNGSSDDTVTVLHGATLPDQGTPSKAGYEFKGWYLYEDNFNWTTGTKYNFSNPVTDEFAIIAGWEAKTFDYDIIHHFETVEGGTYDTETVTKQAKVGETVHAETISRDGFTLNSGHSSSVMEGVVPATGKLQLHVYYDRQEVTITAMVDGQSTQYTHNYGTPFSAIPIPTKVGYKFSHWKDASNGRIEQDDLITSSMVITAVFTEGDVDYTVKYYLERLTGGTYDQIGSKTYQGKTGATVNAPRQMEGILPEYEPYMENVNLGKSEMTGIVQANGSLELSVYYDRDRLTVVVDPNYSGAGQIVHEDIIQGSFVSSIPKPERVGYAFSGWTDVSDEPVDDSDVILTDNYQLKATWSANPYTAFKVIIKQQDPNDLSEYTQVRDYDLAGKTGLEVDAVSLSVPGYDLPTIDHYHVTTNPTLLAESRGTVRGDGTSVFTVYFDCDTVNVSFELGADVTGTGYDTPQEVTYGSNLQGLLDLLDSKGIKNPSKKFHEFKGWALSAGQGTPLTGTHTFTEDVTLHPVWGSMPTVEYKIEHWFENTEGQYVRDDEKTQVLGPELVGTMVEAEYGNYEEQHYVPDKSHEGTVTELELNVPEDPDDPNDDTNTLRLYYKLERVTITIKPDNGSYLNPAGDESYTMEVAYGATIESPEAPEKPGFKFKHWRNGTGNTQSFPAKITTNITFTAVWDARTDLAYTVDVYFQNINDDGYTKGAPIVISNQTVKTPVTAPTSTTYPGFTYDLDNPLNVTSGYIAADNVIVSEYPGDSFDGEVIHLAMYYDRKMMNVKVYPIAQSEPDTKEPFNLQTRYQGTVEEPAGVRDDGYRPGYTFDGWETSEGYTFQFSEPVTEDTTVIGTWEARSDTPYKVEHYRQSVDGMSYELVDTENLQGVTGETATATVKDLSGEFIGCHENTGHESRIPSGEILADGSLVLKVYYDRDEVVVTVKMDADDEGETYTFLYGDVYSSKIPTPELAGYGFAGWATSADADAASVQMGDAVTQAITLYPVWVAGEDTAYVVEYYLQNVTGDGYDKNDDATVNATGMTGTVATAEEKAFTGFHLNPEAPGYAASGTIQGDGSLVLKLYYDRDVLTVTFELDNGGTEPEQQVLYGALATEPSQPTKTGYVFNNWTVDDVPFVFTTPVTKSMTVKATWALATDTKYTIEHYYQTVDGLGYAEPESEVKTGETNAQVSATHTPKPGFHAALDGDNILSGTIAPDGSLVLKLYYDRDVMIVTVTLGVEETIQDSKTEYELLYESPLSQVTKPERIGYTFASWADDDGNLADTTPVVSDLMVHATWDAMDGIVYKVEHYQQDLNQSTYTLAQTDDLTGTSGTSVDAVSTTFTGFHENTEHGDRVASGIVAGNGSLVLKLYYDRDVYDIQIDDGVNEIVTEQLQYGDTLANIEPEVPTRVGYEFLGWFDESDTEIQFTETVTGPMVITASWNATTAPYTLEHYHQNLDGETYVLAETENLTGTTDLTATATEKSYIGYHLSDTAEQVDSGIVSADGSLVLKLYYDRNVINVWTTDEDGVEVKVPILHGDEAALAQVQEPVRSGYDFGGWMDNNNRPVDFGNDITDIRPVWNPRNDTQYTIEHYWQNTRDDNYVMHETTVHQGTTESIVDAVANAEDYIGFHLSESSDEEVAAFSMMFRKAAYSDNSGTGEITGDGSLVLKLYYDRDILTVKVPDGNGGETEHEIRFGDDVGLDTLQPDAAPGYAFVGWVDDTGNEVDFTTEVVGDIVPKYQANNDTPYVVEHYWQNADDDSYTLHETERLTGTTDTNTTASYRTYTGFQSNTGHSETVSSGIVAGDGGLVLKLYYDRQLLMVKVDAADNGTYETYTVRYGGTMTAPADPVKAGYVFEGWENENGQTVDFAEPITSDMTVTPVWSTEKDVEYKVERYQQNTDGSYVLFTTDVFYAETGTTVNATVTVYKGYKYNPDHPNQVSSGIVAGDGSLVLKLYYDRADIVLHIGLQDEFVESTVPFGTKPDDITVPEIPGYEFMGWFTVDGAPADFQNPDDYGFYTLYQARGDVKYTVEYYWQNVVGNGYTVHETKTYTGTTGMTVRAEAMDYLGFDQSTHKNSVTQAVLAGNGTTVLRVYYDRIELTVKIDKDDGSDPIVRSIRFGDLVSLEDLTAEFKNLMAPEFLLDGWVDSSGNEVTFESEVDGTIVPNWVEDPDYEPEEPAEDETDDKDDDNVVIDPDINITDGQTPTGVPNTGITSHGLMFLMFSGLFMMLAVFSGGYLLLDNRRKTKR